MKLSLFFVRHKHTLVQEVLAFPVKHGCSFHVIYVSSVLFLVRDDICYSDGSFCLLKLISRSCFLVQRRITREILKLVE